MQYMILRKKASGQVVVSEGDFSPPRPWASEDLLWKGVAESQEEAWTKAKEAGAFRDIPAPRAPYT